MLIGQVSHYFFGITLFVTSLFLILLVLVQRGRGGGIAGALGGAGGQSAFGTKAGDLFTRITVGVASFWILICCLAIYVMKTPTFNTGFSGDSSTLTSDQSTSDKAGAGKSGTDNSGNSPLVNPGVSLTPPVSDAPKINAPTTPEVPSESPKTESPKTETPNPESPKTESAAPQVNPEANPASTPSPAAPSNGDGSAPTTPNN